MKTAVVVALRDALEAARQGLEAAGWAVAHAGDDPRAALGAIEAIRPACVVLDDAVLAAQPGLAAAWPALGVPLVFLARSASWEAWRRATACGAREVVPLDGQHWPLALAEACARCADAAQPDEPGRPAAGRIVAVFSPKGGVGKTLIAANLAVALADAHRQPVAAVDLDLQFGALAAVLGVEPEASWADAARLPAVDGAAVRRLLTPVPGTGVGALAAPPDPAADVPAARVAEVLGWLCGQAAWVVVDLPSLLTDVALAALDLADTVCLVAAPDIVTLRLTARAAALLRETLRVPAAKLRLVLNRADTGTGITADDAAEVLGLPVAWSLPSDGSRPAAAANAGRPLLLEFPSGALSAAIRDWARSWVEAVEGPGRATRRRWWTRPRWRRR